MFTVTRYCVQIIPRPSARPREVETVSFHAQPEAERHAEIACRRAAKVKVYAVTGEPVWDLWRKPVLIATYAQAPGPVSEAASRLQRCA